MTGVQTCALPIWYLAPPDTENAVSHWIEEWDPLERFVNSVKVPGTKTTNATLLPSTIELTLTVLEERGPRTQQFLFPVRVGRYLL